MLKRIVTSLAKRTSSSQYSSGPQSKHFPIQKSTALPNGSFDGKVAFITGGGTGLGKGMTKKFAELGATVVISSRKQNVLDATAEELNSIGLQGKVVPIACDVRNPAAIKEAVDKMQELTGQLPSVVVNNAAGNFISPTERLSANAFRTIVEIVMLGSANVTLEIGKRLIDADQGCAFLGITTPYARAGSGFVVPSACSKAGVEILYKSLAGEWGKYGMRFNIIAPGPIYTEGAFSRLNPNRASDGYEQKVWELIPCGRIGQIEEIANVATFVSSDYASWLNGAILDFDGGKAPQTAGEFNKLHMHSAEDWDKISQLIRTKAKSS